MNSTLTVPLDHSSITVGHVAEEPEQATPNAEIDDVLEGDVIAVL